METFYLVALMVMTLFVWGIMIAWRMSIKASDEIIRGLSKRSQRELKVIHDSIKWEMETYGEIRSPVLKKEVERIEFCSAYGFEEAFKKFDL